MSALNAIEIFMALDVLIHPEMTYCNLTFQYYGLYQLYAATQFCTPRMNFWRVFGQFAKMP